MKVQNIGAVRNTNFNHAYGTNKANTSISQSIDNNYTTCGAQALAVQNIAFGNMQQKNYRQETINAIKAVIKPAIEQEDVAGILNALGYEAYTDEDGLVVLEGDFESDIAYNNVSFEELGVDEQMLFDKIKRIKGDCLIGDDSKVSSTGALERVDKGLYIYGPVTDVPNLRYIGEDADLSCTISGYDIDKELIIEGRAIFHNSSRDWDADSQEEFKNVKAGNILIIG